MTPHQTYVEPQTPSFGAAEIDERLGWSEPDEPAQQSNRSDSQEWDNALEVIRATVGRIVQGRTPESIAINAWGLNYILNPNAAVTPGGIARRCDVSLKHVNREINEIRMKLGI